MVRTFSSKKTPLFDKLHRWRRLAVMRTNPQSIRCEEQNGFLLIMVPTQLVIEIIILSVFLTFHFFAKSCEIIDQKCLHVTGLIPARAGSKGIKDKNLSILGNETLLGRTLRIMKECGRFDSIWVSTDGNKIADETIKYDSNVHWRDPKTATDVASTLSAVEDFLVSHPESYIVGVIQCTSPFLKKEFLSKALDLMVQTGADCVFSASRSHQLRWTEIKDKFVSPLNFHPAKRPRRQDWDGELVENGMFYFAKTKLIFEDKTLQNNRCKVFEIPKKYSLEIDNKDDLIQARAMLPLLEGNASASLS